ncbi:TonB-dependent siderophore receptor [Kingella sp. (in: b-proteobacteria)]|uniref:TonB-dependent siderophore receptor n=1 Tax=Kingella sp. (in: b-proteobacteria) TaxID=2020713 RepID=UPI0026DC7DE5|nr:TonB-dependent siderophore receptor [Kingella sp. (in: b-proteobacteria)]MDO4656623.1 TonB-dependent siderophore receptor [Kingella sp. (in: b-proteobacteria)]
MKAQTQLKIRTLALCIATLPAAAFAENASTELQNVNVYGKRKIQDSYTESEMSSATGLKLAPKDTPQSVSVITRKQLDDLGATTLEDALKMTTGINVVRRGNYTQYQSRGFNINSITTNGINSTIASVSGNNLHNGKQLSDTALYERIEVLRGGSGMKQTNSEPGGSINMVLKRPTSQPLAEFEASADRWGTVRGVADVSGVLSEAAQIRGRAVAVLERDNTFRDHVDGNNALIFATADKFFGEKDKLTVGALYHRQTETPLGFGLPSDKQGNPLRLKRDIFWGSDWDKATHRKLHTFAEWEHYFNDDWKLTAKADYKRNTSVSEQAQLSGSCASCGTDDGTLPLDSFARHNRRNSQWAGMMELDGKYGAFGNKHDFYAAYSATREKFDIEQREQPTANRAFNLHTWTGHEIPRPDWSVFDYRDYRNSRYTTHTLTLANRFNFGRFHLLLGTGYSHWKNDFIWYRDTRNGAPDFAVRNQSHYRKGRFIPYAAVSFDVNEHNTLYASYTSIFKHTSALDADNKELPAVLGNSYELGWKSAWREGRLNTTLALFQTEKHNEPISTRLRHPVTRNWIYEPVRVQSRGIDAEIAGNISDNWQIFAGYTYNTRKYTKTAGRQTLFVAGADFSQHTPRHMLRVHTAYRLPGAASRWTLTGGFSTQSKHKSWDVAQPLGGYTVWNAGVQYEPNKHMKLTLNVNNLTDKRYYENYEARTKGWGWFYGEPRNVVLNFKWKL